MSLVRALVWILMNVRLRKAFVSMEIARIECQGSFAIVTKVLLTPIMYVLMWTNVKTAK